MNRKRKKLEHLKSNLADTKGLAVAFSGGVDSTFLAAVAHDVLGDSALAVTALSPLYPRIEQEHAAELAGRMGITHVTVESDELNQPGFSANPPDRCYICKTGLYRIVRSTAADHGIKAIADGTNADDLFDYRPGLRAAREQSVLTPLLDAGLTKEEIRHLSREINLPTADKPAMACLASRIPYGERITADKLAAVESLESALRDMGFTQVRVRHHGDTARIEITSGELARLVSPETGGLIVKAGKMAGFTYVTADIEGYRTGSMNECLTQSAEEEAQ